MQQKAINVAIAGALLIGAAGAANANFYGVAINQITNFTISSSAGGIAVGSQSINSVDLAIWNPNIENNGDTLPIPVNPEVADCGPGGCDIGLAQDFYAPLVPNPSVATVTGDWARGDAEVSDPNIFLGGAAANIAEVSAKAGTTTPLPQIFALGENSLDADITVGAGLFTVQFDAEPYINVWSGPDVNDVGAGLEFNITLQDANGVNVFNWVPDGVPGPTGGTGGGNASLEPFSLNLSQGASNGVGNPAAFNPGIGRFMATVNLAAGTYRILVTQVESAEGSQVPVPATLALLGAGLLGLGAIRRRRAKS